jgi:hypothetical protein
MMSAVPVHSLYGEPATRFARFAPSPEGSRPAPAGGMPYDDRHCLYETGGNPCQGYKAKNTDYCMGHLRSIAKAKLKVEADESE